MLLFPGRVSRRSHSPICRSQKAAERDQVRVFGSIPCSVLDSPSQQLRQLTSVGASTLIAVIRFPVHELSMNFAPQRVDHGYLKVLIVAKALVAEVSGNFSTILDGFRLRFELDPDSISMGDAILHIEEELLHCDYLCTQMQRVNICSERTARRQQSDRDHCRMIGLPMHDRTPAARGVRRMAAPDAPALRRFFTASRGRDGDRMMLHQPSPDSVVI
jgi:hypothetical protein